MAVITGEVSDLVVVDADSPEAAARWQRTFPVTPLTCQTGRGIHFYFRHPGIEIRNRSRVLKQSIDIRADGGYVVAPPSIHPDTQTPYEWLDYRSKPWQWSQDEIPIFDPAWIGQQARTIPVDVNPARANIERARRYIAKIVAVSGQGGHNATFRAVCRLASMGVSEDEMLGLMLEWNETNAKPNWTEAEIRHKVNGALRNLAPRDAAVK